MDSLRRASAVAFYLLGFIIIVLVVLVRREIMGATLLPVLHVLDLPLLLAACLFAGSSLYCSLTKGRASTTMLLVVFVPLVAVFLFFSYLNFTLPFQLAF